MFIYLNLITLLVFVLCITVVTGNPSAEPTSQPTIQPTRQPTRQPSSQPSRQPTGQPSMQPIIEPTGQPSRQPTTQPTRQPSAQPSGLPTGQPTAQPSIRPTGQPSTTPTGQPTLRPTGRPSGQPTGQPSSQPSSSPTRQPSRQPTAQPSSSPTSQPSRHPTGQPSVQPTGLPTMQPTTQPSRQPSAQPTASPTRQPSSQPSSSPTAQPTVSPTAQPSRQPSAQPSGQPTSRPTGQPTMQPTGSPTRQPSAQPSGQPTAQPSSCPSTQPSRQPTSQPTSQPSAAPTAQPSCQPTSSPTGQPSAQPSGVPTTQPTGSPTSQPTRQPTRQPSSQPTVQPSRLPTTQPSSSPTSQPSVQPSRQPSSQPTAQPSSQPSGQPSVQPSSQPTSRPTSQPSTQPTSVPTTQPSVQPTRQPSTQPTSNPSMQPSARPSSEPTSQPSGAPSAQPSAQPSGRPTAQPSVQPTCQPSGEPTGQPSSSPSTQPSTQPSGQPSSAPTMQPSVQPTSQPTGEPTSQPSEQPSCQPSAQPSTQPTSAPTVQPSAQPMAVPTMQPTAQPSVQPTAVPSTQPSTQPSLQPTRQPSSQPSAQPSSLPTTQPSQQPTSDPTAQSSAQPTSQPSVQPTMQPTVQPTAQPTSLPSSQPSSQPSMQPTTQPSSVPSAQPSAQPSSLPTAQPSGQPTGDPTAQPSTTPSSQPTAQPTDQPSSQPTAQPTTRPSVQPTIQPTTQPSVQPSTQPSTQPSSVPTTQPTMQPTSEPSGQPTSEPTSQPSAEPSSTPSSQPSSQPSAQPTVQPTALPSTQPTHQPTSEPSGQPTSVPTAQPSVQPTSAPSGQPSGLPTSQPSGTPTAQPSSQPSGVPTTQPSEQPSAQPTGDPSAQPTSYPTSQPTSLPSSQPTTQPSARPSTQPSSAPTCQPSVQPSSQPSLQPASAPTSLPTSQPSSRPTGQPTQQPSQRPTGQPSVSPTRQPTAQPSRAPTMQPSSQPSAQPSLRPTTAMQIQITYAVRQMVESTTRERFLRDPNADLVFRTTVARLVSGIEPSNVEILNMTDVVRSSSARLMPVASAGHGQGRMDLTATQIDGVILDYRLVFVTQRVLVSHSDPAEAFKVTAKQLEQGMRSSAFNYLVQPLAQQMNSTALRTATTNANVFGINPAYTTVVVHSAMPSSQPTSQPSALPTAQPSAQPSASPTRQPSTQPTTVPTAQPSTAPTLSVETDWMNETATVFRRDVPISRADRTAYYAMEVNAVNLYGSCESWMHYLGASLSLTRRAKMFHSLSLISETGREHISSTAYTCDDTTVAEAFVEALNSPFDGTIQVNKTMTCDGHRWVVRDCAVPTDSRHARVTNVSRALCVDCEDPCADYDCADLPGRAVLSPCTRVPNCGSRTGSLQVFVAAYRDSAGEGHDSALMWFGVLWAFLFLSVLAYDAQVRMGRDVVWVRRLPALRFAPQNAEGKSNAYAVAPDNSVEGTGGESRPSTAMTATDITVTESCKKLTTMMTAILDRLTIARSDAGWSALGDMVAHQQRFWYRMVSYNHYLAPYCSATQRERFLHGLNVLTRVSWLFFCVALCLWYNYPEDDDSCYFRGTAEECGQRASPFDSSQEYCTWAGIDELSTPEADGSQPLHQAQCVWQVHTGSVVAALHIVILSITAVAIPRIVYTTFLLESVLLCPGPSTRVFGSSAPGVRRWNLNHRVHRTNRIQQLPHQHAAAGLHAANTADDIVDPGDARLFSLTLTPGGKGGLESYLESGSSQDTADLLYRSFLFEVMQYRTWLQTVDEDRSAEFQDEWQAANPYVLKNTLSLALDAPKAGAQDDEREVADAARNKVLLTNELYAVTYHAQQLVPAYKALLKPDDDQFSVRLMVLFFADLLGKDSIQSRLVQRMLGDLLQHSAPFRDVRNWVKFCVILFFLATCLCLVYGSIALLEGFSARRQWYWVITAAVAVAVDLAVVEGVEALWFQWALPLCVADALSALRHTFMDVMQRFERGLLKSGGSMYSVRTTASSATFASGLKDFSMPNYQFVSTNLARRFPCHVASRIVLSYESVYPRTITGQRWPIHQTGHWSSGLGVESVGYVIFSTAVMWVGIHVPKCVVQLVITGLTSLALWLVSWAVLSFLRGDYSGLLIVAAALVVLALVAGTHRFSWDHDSEHYGEGYGALQVADVLRKPPTAAQKQLASPDYSYGSQPTRKVRVNFRVDTDGAEDHFPSRPGTGWDSPLSRAGTARSALSSAAGSSKKGARERQSGGIPDPGRGRGSAGAEFFSDADWTVVDTNGANRAATDRQEPSPDSASHVRSPAVVTAPESPGSRAGTAPVGTPVHSGRHQRAPIAALSPAPTPSARLPSTAAVPTTPTAPAVAPTTTRTATAPLLNVADHGRNSPAARPPPPHHPPSSPHSPPATRASTAPTAATRYNVYELSSSSSGSDEEKEAD